MKHAVFGPTQSLKDGGVYSNFEHVSACLAGVTDVSMFITGGGKGIEALAEQYAKQQNIPVEKIRPNFYNLFGSTVKNPNININELSLTLRHQVFAARNDDIINKSDKVIFFWDGEFFEIGQLIRRALALRKPILLFPI